MVFKSIYVKSLKENKLLRAYQIELINFKTEKIIGMLFI